MANLSPCCFDLSLQLSSTWGVLALMAHIQLVPLGLLLYISLLASVMVTVGIVCSAAFTSFNRSNEGILPLSFTNEEGGLL